MRDDAQSRNKKADTLEPLERLVALKEQGTLTEAEFTEAKRRVLGL
jgi:hypothetical protein